VEPEVVPSGKHDVTVRGARRIDHKSGAVSVELQLELLGSGQTVALDRLLVHSLGGTSLYIQQNQVALRNLAGAEPGTDLSVLIDRLQTGTVQAGVLLSVGKDMNGHTVNKLNDVVDIIEDGDDDEG
jgi:hypothetical protein